MLSKKYDMFISYSREDETIVYSLVTYLKMWGYSVWMDSYGIHYGEEFKERIVTAIENSELFLFFSSKNSNASKWTIKEVSVASSRGKVIVPIRLDNCNYQKSIELDLIDCDYVDCTSSFNTQQIKKLRASIEGYLGVRMEKELHSNVNEEILRIADKFRKGEGVERDLYFAKVLYNKAAEQGNSEAQCNLAIFYLNGWGCEKDIYLAVALFNLAIKGGSVLALYNLGLMFFDGSAGKVDYNHAILLLQEAASKGCFTAIAKLKELGISKW